MEVKKNNASLFFRTTQTIINDSGLGEKTADIIKSIGEFGLKYNDILLKKVTPQVSDVIFKITYELYIEYYKIYAPAKGYYIAPNKFKVLEEAIYPGKIKSTSLNAIIELSEESKHVVKSKLASSASKQQWIENSRYLGAFGTVTATIFSGKKAFFEAEEIGLQNASEFIINVTQMMDDLGKILKNTKYGKYLSNNKIVSRVSPLAYKRFFAFLSFIEIAIHVNSAINAIARGENREAVGHALTAVGNVMLLSVTLGVGSVLVLGAAIIILAAGLVILLTEYSEFEKYLLRCYFGKENSFNEEYEYYEKEYFNWIKKITSYELEQDITLQIGSFMKFIIPIKIENFNKIKINYRSDSVRIKDFKYDLKFIIQAPKLNFNLEIIPMITNDEKGFLKEYEIEKPFLSIDIERKKIIQRPNSNGFLSLLNEESSISYIKNKGIELNLMFHGDSDKKGNISFNPYTTITALNDVRLTYRIYFTGNLSSSLNSSGKSKINTLFLVD